MSDSDMLGLIAGAGRLPFLVAAGAKQAGLRVICVGLGEDAEASLADEVDVFYKVGVARPGAWIRKVKKHNVTRAIMVGRVAKKRRFTPWRIVRYLPDWRALRIYYLRLRGRSKFSHLLLRALADELAGGGIILENSTMYCKEHLATAGVMTSVTPRSSAQGDVDFGWGLVKKCADMGKGEGAAGEERG